MAQLFRLPRRGARTEWRIFFVAIVMLAGIGALLAKLWWEQVARGPFWSKKIAGRSQVTVRIPSVRGEIRDRNGITLVGNRASYEVDFYLPDIVRGFREINGFVPRKKYLETVSQMMTERKRPDIVQIVNDTIVKRLNELKLAKDYNSERLEKHFRTNEEVPFTYLEELDFKTLARFSEHDVGLPWRGNRDPPGAPVRLRSPRGASARLCRRAFRDDQTAGREGLHFYQPTWRGNPRSNSTSTNTSAARQACG
jgi:penicillin-binding protein 2